MRVYEYESVFSCADTDKMVQPSRLHRDKKGTWCLWKKQPYFCQESYQDCRDCPVYLKAIKQQNEAFKIAENMEDYWKHLRCGAEK